MQERCYTGEPTRALRKMFNIKNDYIMYIKLKIKDVHICKQVYHVIIHKSCIYIYSITEGFGIVVFEGFGIVVFEGFGIVVLITFLTYNFQIEKLCTSSPKVESDDVSI